MQVTYAIPDIRTYTCMRHMPNRPVKSSSKTTMFDGLQSFNLHFIEFYDVGYLGYFFAPRHQTVSTP